MYTDKTFLNVKIQGERINQEAPKIKKENRTFIDEMDDVLKDLASWKKERQKKDTEEKVTPPPESED
jgi:hypothetical protein